MSKLIDQAMSRDWFYPYKLPDGRITPTHRNEDINTIHDTRWLMLEDCIDRYFEAEENRHTAIDLGCHQGYFSVGLAQAGFAKVLGIDARHSHIDDSNLIAEIYGLRHLRLLQKDINAIDPDSLGRFNLVLMLGLLYHLENPIGALRLCRKLCDGICIIETQLTPNTSGFVDYGSHEFVRQMRGSFNIIDETGETSGPESGISDICLIPSYEALIWTLIKVGFSNVIPLKPPEDGWDQLRHHKRVMVVAIV